MHLFKRDQKTGAIVAMVDTAAMTDDERATVFDELHELVAETKVREAVRITEHGLDAQIEYLLKTDLRSPPTHDA